MVYIRQEQLPKLREYKYSGVDKSLLSRFILKPFYTNVAIKFFPLSMAPNAITLSGFGFVVLNILTMLYYTPTLDQDCPPWVYASWALGLFLYQTFDAVDGTQARRTKQSGPLGELFDHGVDACNTTLEVFLFAAAMKLGQSWKTVAVLFASLFTFYTQTWEEYHTHTLTLGLISGPVEGVLTLCIVYAFTALKGGASFWQQSMLETFGVPKTRAIPSSIYDLAFTDWYLVYGGVVLLFNTVQSATTALKARGPRYKSAQAPLMELLPFFGPWILIVGILGLQPFILREQLVPFMAFIGLINAYLVGQIIVAHLLKSEFPWNNILIFPLIFGFGDGLGPFLQQMIGLGWPAVLDTEWKQAAFVYACLGLALGVYGSFVADVITDICDYLDIWCLHIKHPHQEDQKPEKKAQ